MVAVPKGQPQPTARDETIHEFYKCHMLFLAESAIVLGLFTLTPFASLLQF